jgi:hypothetical protein
MYVSWYTESGHEADHSLQSTSKVKNSWSYTSSPQYVFMAWCIVKHKDNFTLIYHVALNQVWKYVYVCLCV